METIYHTMSDGKNIALYNWKSAKKPVAVIHIIHGMAEHARRYERFANEAIKNNIEVFASDLRGHGNSVEHGSIYGHTSDKDGFVRIVEDQKEINSEIKKKYPQLPIIILGHSFGSFITQSYIENYGNTIDKCVLIGSSGPNNAVRFGKFLADFICFFRGRKRISQILHNLSLGAYNKKIKHIKTNCDWLSRDEDEVKKYINDPFCNFICPSGFYKDLMNGLIKIHKINEIKKIPVTLPILILAGSKDPVSKYGRTLKKLHHIYLKTGISNTTLKLYENARHELLNEINRDEVTSDILNWIKNTAL